MLKCDFNKLLQHGCSPVNLLHIFRTTFPKKTSEGYYFLAEHLRVTVYGTMFGTAWPSSCIHVDLFL